jgi:hypothetical protein
MHLQKKLIPFTVFFIVANPATFKAVRSIAGNWVASADGLPTTAGLLLHALVFVIVAHCLWKMIRGPKMSDFAANMKGEGATME